MDTPTPEERDRIIRSVIATQALEGIVVERETAERLFDEAWTEDMAALDARLGDPYYRETPQIEIATGPVVAGDSKAA